MRPPRAAPIRTVVVDDEPLARSNLRLRLERQPGFTVVGEFGSAREAATAIEAADPDLLFLDVRMPGGDGFELLRLLGRRERPHIVFVTAHDDFAVRAFDVAALDYLVKPFDDLRFARTLRRVRRALTEAGAGGTEPPRHLVARSGRRTVLLRLDEVDWIEGAGDYARVHGAGGAHLVQRTLQELEETLAAAGFVRIHRSTIVNLDRVRELHTRDGRDYRVRLDDGTELRLSRTYRERVESALGESL